MKVLVTGATGVIGTRAVPALVAAGHEVTAVARSAAKADLVRSFGAVPVEVDLFDREAVKAAVDGHDAVANLATKIPPISQAAKAGAWDENERIRSEGSANLVDAALAVGAGRFVQESIAFPYRDGGDAWIHEDHPLDHDGPFVGAGVAEANVARFAEEGGIGVVLRFAQFYAADSAHTIAFNKAARWRINAFLGEPDAYVSSIHAEDAGAAVPAALTAPAGVYNVADDEPLTRTELGAVLAAANGVRRVRLVPRWARALGPSSARSLAKSLRVSNARFKEATGWAPAHPSVRGSWPGTR